MYLDFNTIVNNLNFKVNGIIHIGGHIGEEIPSYIKYTNNIHIFEPQLDCFNQIPDGDGVIKYNCALAEKETEMDFYVADNRQSSSLLKPKLHLTEHPTVHFTDVVRIPVKTLDSFNIIDCNFLNMDIQGYELNVLKGAEKTLENIEVIYTEVNIEEVYENNSLLSDLDDWLESKQFKRIWKYITPHKWGDALYVKSN
jgi:FkbM family methyltransferase